MTRSSLTERARRAGLAGGLDVVGVASAEAFDDTRRVLEQRKAAGLAGTMQFTYRNPARACDPSRTLPGARSLVVGALGYLRAAPPASPPPDPAGRVARYAWVDHYAALRCGLDAVAAELRRCGQRAVVVADDNALVDRAAAARAGIGWYGKNTTVLLPGRGSWYVLGSVITDAELVADEPVASGCGSCSRCLPACPTGALTEPGVLDARRCLAWLAQAPGVFPREYREALGDRIYGCDDCQEACPVNHRAARLRPPPPASPTADATVDLLDLLRRGDEELLEQWGRWYIAARDPRHLRRNALVILGNVADPDDPAVLSALRAALRDPDPLLRAHAVWAAARLGCLDEAEICAADRDPGVQDELAAAASIAPRRRPAGDGDIERGGQPATLMAPAPPRPPATGNQPAATTHSPATTPVPPEH